MKVQLSVPLIICLLLGACNQEVTQTPSAESTTVTYPVQYQDYCILVSSPDSTPDPTDEALKALVPPVTDDDWIDGPDNAAVTIVEYTDFQCPGCAGLAPDLDQLRLDFPDNLRIVVRHFPNPVHDKSLLSAQAMEAAGLQSGFWAMKTALFEGQAEWSSLTNQDFEIWLREAALNIGLDPDTLLNDLNTQAIVDKVFATREEAIRLGIPYTPFLLINGVMYQGPREYTSLKDVINLMLLEDRQIIGCPPFTIDITKQYIASIETEKGTILIQLYADKAPLAVNSFVFLAENGFYNGITFHRVVKGYLVQTGDPSGTGYGGPGFTFPNEISESLSFDDPGVVGLANAGPDTNGSQFFITMKAMPDLNGDYTIFGQVIQGMDVVRSLSERDPSQGIPFGDGDKIFHVTVEVN
jgi:cyclophilin family peptidyl-prolyl cis-trans isomerase/protein-disulfide isomerase